MDKLPKEIHQKIQKLAAKGDSLADRERFSEAIAIFKAGWELLPEPRADWEAGLWFVSAVMDSHFHAGEFAELVTEAGLIVDGELAQNSAFFQLRYGQALLEVDKSDEAKAALQKAFDLGGEEMFEDEDEKYSAFLT